MREAGYAFALCMLSDCILQSYIREGAVPCDHIPGVSQVIPEIFGSDTAVMPTAAPGLTCVRSKHATTVGSQVAERTV